MLITLTFIDTFCDFFCWWLTPFAEARVAAKPGASVAVLFEASLLSLSETLAQQGISGTAQFLESGEKRFGDGSKSAFVSQYELDREIPFVNCNIC